MNTGGTLIYKCRRCFSEDRSVHVPDILRALVLISAGRSCPEPWGPLSPRMTTIHLCKESTPQIIGIADLIGGEEDS